MQARDWTDPTGKKEEKLMNAVWHPSPSAVDDAKEALREGADPNRNVQGDSLLHEAIRRNNLPVANLLLDMGARPDMKNRAGRTPYDEAVAKGHKDIAERLLGLSRGSRVKAMSGIGGRTRRRKVRTTRRKKVAKRQ
jgi:hypothetical protein